MKLDAAIILLFTVAVGLVIWEHRRDDATLRRIRASADSLAAVVDSAAAVHAEERRADSLRLAYAKDQIVRLRASYNRTQYQTDTVLTAVLTTDTAAVVALRGAIDAERAACRELVDTLTSQRDTAWSRVAYWQDAQRGTADQLAISTRLLHEALQARRPSRFWRGALVGAAAVGVVLALR